MRWQFAHWRAGLIVLLLVFSIGLYDTMRHPSQYTGDDTATGFYNGQAAMIANAFFLLFGLVLGFMAMLALGYVDKNKGNRPYGHLAKLSLITFAILFVISVAILFYVRFAYGDLALGRWIVILGAIEVAAAFVFMFLSGTIYLAVAGSPKTLRTFTIVGISLFILVLVLIFVSFITCHFGKDFSCTGAEAERQADISLCEGNEQCIIWAAARGRPDARSERLGYEVTEPTFAKSICDPISIPETKADCMAQFRSSD